MNRRSFLQTLPAAAATLALACSGREARRTDRADRQVMTVRGPIHAGDMGVTLPHEHLLANFQPYDERAEDPLTYNVDEVVEIVLPHLKQLHDLGCRTFIDATATFLGRDPVLIRRLSEESGLHMLTVTGNYAAVQNQFLPPYVYTDTPDALAQRWIDEWTDGIDGTGIRPGFIKLGFNGDSLTDVEQTLIRAAATTHLETGLTIGAHTGPAVSAFEQLAVLEAAGVHPSAWIWIHAQNEDDPTRHVEAARRGAWISFDGVRPDSVAAHVEMVMHLRDNGLLHRVLVSQDAGWYSVGEPRGGDFRPFDTVFTTFIPALRETGFTDEEVETLFIDNPANAFSIEQRTASNAKS